MVFAFPFVSVRETVVCRWNAVSFSLKGFPKNFPFDFFFFLFFFASSFRISFFFEEPTYRSYDFRKVIGFGMGNHLAEGFFFFPFLENFLQLTPLLSAIVTFKTFPELPPLIPTGLHFCRQLQSFLLQLQQKQILKFFYKTLAQGYIPVVSTVAQGTDGNTAYNINADTAAAKLAVALGAEKLVLLTDVRGLLRDPKDESTLIHSVGVSEIPGLIKDGIISGGMIPKIDCAVEAVRSGVNSTVILDGRIPHSILIELLSDDGAGTMLVR